MDNQEHIRFLQQKANEIHKLYLVPANKICFDTQMKRFEEMSVAWETALNQAAKDANADSRLRQEPKDEKPEPPKEGYIWDHYNGLWRSEGPPDPMKWVWPLDIPKNEIEENIGWDLFSELPPRDPTDSEKLMCDYFLLVVIHDGALDTVADNRIYFDTTNKEPKEGCIYMWKDLNGSSIALIPTVAMRLWKHLKICNSYKARTIINRVLMDVKTEQTNPKSTFLSVLVSFLGILAFILWIHRIPIAWIKDHPNGLGLQGSIIFLIPCLVVGYFKPKCRKWCWGVGALSFLVLIISLL